MVGLALPLLVLRISRCARRLFGSASDGLGDAAAIDEGGGGMGSWT